MMIEFKLRYVILPLALGFAIGGLFAAIDDEEALFLWATYYQATLFGLSLLTSLIACTLVYRRRHCFPFNSMNVGLLMAVEMWVPYTMISGNYAFPNMPCVMTLFTWDAVPTLMVAQTIMIIRIWLDFHYNLAQVKSRDGWLLRYYKTLTTWPLAPILVILLVLEANTTSLSQLSRKKAIFSIPSVTEDYACYTMTLTEEAADLTNNFLYGVLLFFGSYFALRQVQDAFGWKSALMNAAVSMSLGAQFYQIFYILSQWSPIANNYPMLSLWLLVCSESSFMPFMYTVSWVYTIKFLRVSFEEERAKNRYQQQEGMQKATEGGSGDAAAAKGDYHVVQSTLELQPILLDEDVLSNFRDYLVTEFCVENIIFFRELCELRKLEDRDKVKDKVSSICKSFVSLGSVHELNIGSRLRQDTLSEVASLLANDGQTLDVAKMKDVYGVVEKEVLLMMLEPFNRYTRKRRRGGVAAIKTSAILPADGFNFMRK